MEKVLTANGVVVGVSISILIHGLPGDGDDMLIATARYTARSHTRGVESGLALDDIPGTNASKDVSNWVSKTCVVT